MSWRNYPQTLFQKIKIEHISGSIVYSFIQLISIACLFKGYRSIVNPNWIPLAFTLYKAFEKTKRGLELVSLTHYLHHFWRKIFFLLYSIWPNFIVWLPLIREILSNIFIVIVYEPGCDVINFEIDPIFLIKQFLLHEQKFRTKI